MPSYSAIFESTFSFFAQVYLSFVLKLVLNLFFVLFNCAKPWLVSHVGFDHMYYMYENLHFVSIHLMDMILLLSYNFVLYGFALCS